MQFINKTAWLNVRDVRENAYSIVQILDLHRKSPPLLENKKHISSRCDKNKGVLYLTHPYCLFS